MDSLSFLNILSSLTCKVSEQFVHSEDLQDLHQSDHLASPANDMVILQSLQNERDVKWEQGPQVYEVHGFFQKLKFVWTADESHNKFNCEEDKSWDINNLNFYPGYDYLSIKLIWIFAQPNQTNLASRQQLGSMFLLLTVLLHSWHNEGDGRNKKDR